MKNVDLGHPIPTNTYVPIFKEETSGPTVSLVSIKFKLGSKELGGRVKNQHVSAVCTYALAKKNRDILANFIISAFMSPEAFWSVECF